MPNYFIWLQNPQFNFEKLFEVMRDFRKGGINPTNYDSFISQVKKLPPINSRKAIDYFALDKMFNLVDISADDFQAIINEVTRRGIENSKFCWHPLASINTCNLDKSGKIIISAAHSIQNNGILSRIVENGHVKSYNFEKGELVDERLGRNHASIFWGFCNTHDSIFKPIEIEPYKGSDEQHFLFAYRGFVVSSHKKIEVSSWINFGDQSKFDIDRNKQIFDNAILNMNYSCIKTEVIQLPAFYPIAVSSAFYLEFDFEGNEIVHSDSRMEDIFITLFPHENKTFFLLSYFVQDILLYGNLFTQLKKRNNLRSDISMLIAAHVENVYFHPQYYDTFIRQHEDKFANLFMQSQMDFAQLDENNEIINERSLTPNNYLNNEYSINFFGY